MYEKYRFLYESVLDSILGNKEKIGNVFLFLRYSVVKTVMLKLNDTGTYISAYARFCAVSLSF